MPILEISELWRTRPVHGRLLGLDIGTKTIGLALSDLTAAIATPHSTIRRTKFTQDAKELFAIVDKEGVFGLVLGFPISMDGTEGARCQSVKSFADNLDKVRPVPMVLWDERMSTVAVTRVLLDADASRKRRAEVVDKMAAAYILQGALDAKNIRLTVF